MSVDMRCESFKIRIIETEDGPVGEYETVDLKYTLELQRPEMRHGACIRIEGPNGTPLHYSAVELHLLSELSDWMRSNDVESIKVERKDKA